jgi:thioredoxin reductase (NADPH)
MSLDYETDVVVVGAGPVGLFAIFELGMLKMRTHVIDALDFTGGQCTALYPEKPIFDIPAHPQVRADKLIEQLEEQAAPFDPVYHLGEQVVKVEKYPSGGFIVETSKGKKITAKAIVIAAGCGAFGPKRPPLEGIEDFEGKSVFYMVKRKEDFRDKTLVIAGGGDSAVDWIMSLADVAKKTYVVHRRPKFRAADANVDRVHELAAAGAVELVIPYQLDNIKGTNGQLETVGVKDLDGNTKDIEADILLPFFGLSMELGPIAEWGLNLHMNHIDVTPSTMETSEKGIFAIGDINHYPGKLKLIACGFAEGAMAAHAAYPLVHDEALHFEYSTTKGVPE